MRTTLRDTLTNTINKPRWNPKKLYQYPTGKTRKEKQRKRQKIDHNMSDISINISIITINASDLNTLIKRDLQSGLE